MKGCAMIMGRKITMNGQFLEGGERSIFPHPAEVFNSITPKTREIKCELQIIAVDICRRMWYDNRAKQVEYCWTSVVLQIGVLYPFLMLTFFEFSKNANSVKWVCGAYALVLFQLVWRQSELRFSVRWLRLPHFLFISERRNANGIISLCGLWQP